MDDEKSNNKQNLINVFWEKYSTGNVISKFDFDLMMNELFLELAIAYAGNICDLDVMIAGRKSVHEVIELINLELCPMEKLAGEIIDGMAEVRSYECLK